MVFIKKKIEREIIFSLVAEEDDNDQDRLNNFAVAFIDMIREMDRVTKKESEEAS